MVVRFGGWFYAVRRRTGRAVWMNAVVAGIVAVAVVVVVLATVVRVAAVRFVLVTMLLIHAFKSVPIAGLHFVE